jgi:hypothetical protein
MNLCVPSLAVLIPILTLPFWLFYFDITPKVAMLLFGAAVAIVLVAVRQTTAVVAYARSRHGRTIAILLGLQCAALGAADGGFVNLVAAASAVRH